MNAVLRVYRGLPHGFLNLPTQLSKAGTAILEAGVYCEWLYSDYVDRLTKKNLKVDASERMITSTKLRFRSNPKLDKRKGLSPTVSKKTANFE